MLLYRERDPALHQLNLLHNTSIHEFITVNLLIYLFEFSNIHEILGK